MIVVWLKIIHIAALIVWCGGLLALPALYRRRHALADGEPVFELQRIVRRLFVDLVSPAAFIAIASGTALIFAREVLVPWLFLKLAVVALLVALHVRHGYVVRNLFHPGRRFGALRLWLGTGAAALVVSGILALVLGKPDLELERLPDWMLEPGGLQSLAETISPIP